MSVFHFTYKAEIEAIPIMLRDVNTSLEKAKVASKAIWAVSLAVEEIMSNIIYYGFEECPSEENKILLELNVSGEILKVSVADNAKSFNPLTAEDPDVNESLTTRKPGGLGIFFVKSLMDSVEYIPQKKGNLLVLEKKLNKS